MGASRDGRVQGPAGVWYGVHGRGQGVRDAGPRRSVLKVYHGARDNGEGMYTNSIFLMLTPTFYAA